MLEIYRKTVLRWAMRNPAAGHSSHCCIPEGRAGARSAFHAKCHHHHPLASRRKQWGQGRLLVLRTDHPARSWYRANRHPRQAVQLEDKIHTNPFSLPFFFGKRFQP